MPTCPPCRVERSRLVTRRRQPCDLDELESASASGRRWQHRLQGDRSGWRLVVTSSQSWRSLRSSGRTTNASRASLNGRSNSPSSANPQILGERHHVDPSEARCLVYRSAQPFSSLEDDSMSHRPKRCGLAPYCCLAWRGTVLEEQPPWKVPRLQRRAAVLRTSRARRWKPWPETTGIGSPQAWSPWGC